MCLAYCNEKVTKTPKNRFKTYIPIFFKLILNLNKFKKNFPFKISFESNILFFNSRFLSSAECTIHTKYLISYTKTQKYTPKTYIPKCTKKTRVSIIIKMNFVRINYI